LKSFATILNSGTGKEGCRGRNGISRITILSTMLSDHGRGEWGFSALVEIDSERILFDTGNYDQTVIDNAKGLGVDLSNIKELVLSHSHSDHTGGWHSLWEQFGRLSWLEGTTVEHALFNFFRQP